MSYQKFISINPHIRFGKLCVTGTRIAVYEVLSWLSSGMTFEEIISDYRELSERQILACLAFAADRKRRVNILR